MIAALQSSLSAKDMELEVNMKCVLRKIYIRLLPQYTQRTCPNLWPRLRYTGGIWKCSFISTGLGLYRPTNPSRKRSLSSALRFSAERKHFENGGFRKPWRHDNHVVSQSKVFSDTNQKWPVLVPFSNSSASVVWTENICVCVCVCIRNWPLPIGAFQDQCKQTMINFIFQ